MDVHTISLERKLMRSFMQFGRAEWHQRTVAGCKPSEIKVLMCIKKGIKPDNAEIKVSEISRMMHVTSPTITQLIKGLEANGLIERHNDLSDRRMVGIRLTEQGEKVTQQAIEAFTASISGLIEYLGEEESNQLADLMYKVFSYYNEKAASENNSYWHGDEEA